MTTTPKPKVLRAARSRKAPRQHKARIYFHNLPEGKSALFYSNDVFTSQNQVNTIPGLKGLRKLIKKHAGTYTSALIYRVADDALVEQYDGYGNEVKIQINEVID
jgi:hypothetical protein